MSKPDVDLSSRALQRRYLRRLRAVWRAESHFDDAAWRQQYDPPYRKTSWRTRKLQLRHLASETKAELERRGWWA